MNNKKEIIKNICYTDLVYGRINKKLGKSLTKTEIENYIKEVLLSTPQKDFVKTGKNYYAINRSYKIRITINSNTLRIITVDPLKLCIERHN